MPHWPQKRPDVEAPHAGHLVVVVSIIEWECTVVRAVPVAASVGRGTALL